MRDSIIKTQYPSTISMTIEDGDLFADSMTYLEVVDKYSGRYLGYITSEHFADNKYLRTVDGDQLIYVCSFLRD